jgi:hypothetical protein
MKCELAYLGIIIGVEFEKLYVVLWTAETDEARGEARELDSERGWTERGMESERDIWEKKMDLLF